MSCYSHYHSQITDSMHLLLNAGENNLGVKNIAVLAKDWNLVPSIHTCQPLFSLTLILVLVRENLSPFELTQLTFSIVIVCKMK